jgi:hypothetical protein
MIDETTKPVGTTAISEPVAELSTTSEPFSEQARDAAKAASKSSSKKKPSPKRSASKKPKRVAKKPIPRGRPYPRASLEDALKIPYALKEKNGGNPWPPADVAAAIGLSHKNTDFFYIAASSRDFGLTEGSRDSEFIALTEFGRDLSLRAEQR